MGFVRSLIVAVFIVLVVLWVWCFIVLSLVVVRGKVVKTNM
jgi:hypothetical protein